MGIAVEAWTTFHGFALNVSNDLAPFQGFHPCGFDGAVMTSMVKETGRAITVAEVKSPVARAFRVVFGGAGTGRSTSAPRTSDVPMEATAADAR
ncbi:MAG: hypothetical protein L3K08_04410 [Thermoplasmata archaeon]|nr:hypothetical protein [Thermoplasmata archaeon]